MKVIIYDRSPEAGPVGLTWVAGAALFTAIGKADLALSVDSVEDFVDCLESLFQEYGAKSIDQIQYWGHGGPGKFVIGSEKIKANSSPKIFSVIKEVMRPNGIFWLRTCASFQGAIGKDFAKMLADTLGCRVAAHTYNIGVFHSGRHILAPGETPTWSEYEGSEVDSNGVRRSVMSHPGIAGTKLFIQDNI